MPIKKVAWEKQLQLSTYRHAWRKKDKKVLAVDMDPQGNMTSGLGVDKDNVENTVYDMIIGESSIDEVIVRDVLENLDIIPTSIDLSGAEIELT